LSANSRNWLILLLTIFSVVCIAAHRYDFFQIELNLLAPENHVAIFPTSSGDIDMSLDVKDNHLVLDCNVKTIESLNFCSFTILLSKTGEFVDYAKGRDLSDYHTLDMDMDFDRPDENPNLRVSFRNFNKTYVKDGDYTSLKYNSMIFEPMYNSTLNKLLLSTFSVEDWWVEQHKIPAAQAELDFSNIAYIEVLPNIISQVANYKITIKRFILIGELISEPTLLLVILALWLLVVVILVTQITANLKHIATTDALTGAMNRRGLDEWVSSHLSSFYNSPSLCMFYIDLDDFKKINDSHGHNIGDELLCNFCERINETVRRYGNKKLDYRFARLAGDEFAVVFFNMPMNLIKPLAEKIIDTLHQPINLSSCSLKISGSVGISSTNPETNTFDELIKNADMAMYFAKHQGKKCFKIFDKSIARDILYRKKISENIKHALAGNEFHLNFMPIYHCSTRKMLKAEVLLRSNGKHLKGIGPDVFIPIAEEFHLIHDIDLWVIEETFKYLSQNRDMFCSQGFNFCINISAIELHHEHFPQKLQTLLERYEIDARCIVIEITETSLIDVNEKSIESLNAIKDLGVSLALDDFGTGYTAFNQLIHYPVSCLKIDKSFVDGLSEKNKTQATMIKAMLSIAESYELETVAEGVETEEQLAFMVKNKCDMAQGYLFDKPMAFEELVKLRLKSLSDETENLDT
jgi:diguanylate cyclase (GGDEF)-like protein